MTLMIASLVSLVLLTIHLAQDIVIGLSPGGLGNIVGLVIGFVYLYGTLALTHRRSGIIIMLVGGFVAVGVSIIHMTKSGLTGPHSRLGGIPFVWVVLALGINGIFCFALAVRQLWLMRSHKSAVRGV